MDTASAILALGVLLAIDVFVITLALSELREAIDRNTERLSPQSGKESAND